MLLMSFSANQPIVLFKNKYVVQSIEDDRVITLRSESGSTKKYEVETLIKHYTAGNLKAQSKPRRHGEKEAPRRVVRKLAFDLSPAAQRDGQTNLEYLRAVESSGVPLKEGPALKEVLDEVTQRLGRKTNPSVDSLRRWSNRTYRSGGDAMAAVPLYDRRGGRGKSRMSKSTQAEMNAVVDNVYLTTEIRSMKTAHEELVKRLAENPDKKLNGIELKIPSYSTFRRSILARNQYEVTASRHGAKAAERIFRSSGRTSELYSFNECWEIDHTVLDLMVVDTGSRMVLGRPRITAAIEYTTGSLMGFDIDFSGTSAQAVLNCLRHAIAPKTYLKERFPEVQQDWPCYGVPMVLKMDNGVEFHSRSLKAACFELGIDLQYCPVARAWYKGRIERFFRTLNENLLNSLPGATGIDLQRRKDVEDANCPVIDLDTLQRILHIWIVDVYMTMPRGGKA